MHGGLRKLNGLMWQEHSMDGYQIEKKMEPECRGLEYHDANIILL